MVRVVRASVVTTWDRDRIKELDTVSALGQGKAPHCTDQTAQQKCPGITHAAFSGSQTASQHKARQFPQTHHKPGQRPHTQQNSRQRPQAQDKYQQLLQTQHKSRLRPHAPADPTQIRATPTDPSQILAAPAIATICRRGSTTISALSAAVSSSQIAILLSSSKDACMNLAPGP